VCRCVFFVRAVNRVEDQGTNGLGKAFKPANAMVMRDAFVTRLRQGLVVCGFALALSSCAVDRTYGAAPAVEVTQLETLPAPRADISYVIGPQEKLEITVVGAEDLGGEFLTDGVGDIQYPYLGNVPIGGKSPSEAAQIIADGLRGRVVLDPQVRVLPAELPPLAISVGGEVKRPGSYPAIGKPTLLTVINQAEGLDQYAKLDDVLIMRSVDGQRYIGLYNVGAIQRGNYDDPRLYPGDIVMVGDSPGRRRIDGILPFIPLVTSAVILIDRVGQ